MLFIDTIHCFTDIINIRISHDCPLLQNETELSKVLNLRTSVNRQAKHSLYTRGKPCITSLRKPELIAAHIELLQDNFVLNESSIID
jgi:hypothetical protein